MIRFDITFLLPSKLYSVNNFTVSYIYHSNTTADSKGLNDFETVEFDYWHNISILILEPLSILSTQVRNNRKELTPLRGQFSNSRTLTFHANHLDPIRAIAQNLQDYHNINPLRPENLLFVEAEYV